MLVAELIEVRILLIFIIFSPVITISKINDALIHVGTGRRGLPRVDGRARTASKQLVFHGL